MTLHDPRFARFFRSLAGAIALAALSSPAHAGDLAPSFFVDGADIRDARGEIFAMRGINHPVVWHYDRCWETVPALAAAGFNAVRVVWNDVDRPTVAQLDAMLQRLLDHEMIPVVELHGGTGSNSVERLRQLVAYWCRDDMRALAAKYRRYLVLNIANEWGNNHLTDADWRDAYLEALATLRARAEYRDLLVMIDASGWGQNPSPVKNHGRELLERDTALRATHGGPAAGNLAFGLHMYGRWDSRRPDRLHVTRELSELRDVHGLAVVVAEFGYNYRDGDNNLRSTVDHAEIMAACHRLGYGYLAWSTCGNSAPNRWLDMMTGWAEWNEWGRRVLDDPHGVRATARKCSLFAPAEAAASGDGGAP